MYLEAAQVSQVLLKWAGAQISIVKLNMVNIVYVYAMMYFC